MKNLTQRLLLGGALATVATTLLMACNKPPEDAPVVTPPAMSMGAQIDDSIITASVKSALLANPDINSFDLQVETRKGVVLVSGFVDSKLQIDQALAVTRSVSGVVDVENGVSLKGEQSTMGTQLEDTAVTSRVKTALLADPDVRSLDISVLTRQGAVQLTGFVNSQAQIEQATTIARAAEGASSVKNELVVKQ
jgi:hyperosmotically inducible periplasmic protein